MENEYIKRLKSHWNEFFTIRHSAKQFQSPDNQSIIPNLEHFVPQDFAFSTAIMHFSLTTILAAASFFMAGTSAVPVQEGTAKALETRECGFHARVDSVWHENALSRRRIVYRNSGGFDGKELGDLWLAEDAIASMYSSYS